MKRIQILSLLLVLTTLWAIQAEPKANKRGTAANTDVQQSLKQMEQDWVQALQKKDIATVDKILAADWSMIDVSGKTISKSDALAALKSGDLSYDSLTWGDMDVRVFGNTAVVTGSSDEKSSYKGKDTSGHSVFTDVFVKRNGNWQAVASQLTHASQ